VRIDIVERSGRVDVKTEYLDGFSRGGRGPGGRRGQQIDGVAVDYTITVPAATSVDVKSVSGAVKVSGIAGEVRAESVSGDVVASATPRLEQAKTVSGSID